MLDAHEQRQAPASRPAGEDSWLAALVREVLQRPAGDLVADATLTSLGITSIQAIALQYQIGERTGLEMPLEALLDEYTIADLVAVLSELQSSWPGGVEEGDADMSQVAEDGE